MTKKAINKHGLKMHGLKKAAGETKGLTGYYSGHYVQISYDRSTGDVLTDYHYSLGQSSWSKYHDPAIITICNASEPMTMRQISDAIKEALIIYIVNSTQLDPENTPKIPRKYLDNL